MRAPRPPMQDVVLDDVEVSALARRRTGPGAPARSETAGSAGSAGSAELAGSDEFGPQRAVAMARARRARRWWTIAAAIAVAVIATTATATERRENARLEALALVPGVLEPLAGPVTELWRSTGGHTEGLTEVGGLLVGVETRADSGVDVVARSATTGEPVWRTVARPPGTRDTWAQCVVPRPASTGATDGDTNGGAVNGTDGGVITCAVADVVAIHENAAGLWPYATRARLLKLDAATGTVLSGDPTAPSTTVAALDGDVVLSQVNRDGRVQLTRTDALGSQVRWTFTSPDPLPDDASGRPQARLSVVSGFVVVNAGSGWVLSGDGSVVRSWEGDPAQGPSESGAVLAGGRLLATPAAADRDGTPRTEIVSRDTGAGFTARARPAGASPDDGTLATLVLLRSATDDTLAAYEVATGALLWTAAGTARGVPAILDGRVIWAGPDELRSIDGRTGSTVWSTSLPRGTAAKEVVTDGRVVLLSRPASEGRGAVVGYGLDDGRARWTAPVADDLDLAVIAGSVYGSSAQSLTALEVPEARASR